MIFGTLLSYLVIIPIYGGLIYVVVLIVKALKKYIKSADVRKEKTEA